MRTILMAFLFSTLGISASASFEPAFIDKDGVKWSAPFSEPASNGCIGPNGTSAREFCSKYIRTAKDSQAQALCESIGARLPTR
ncbi:MAG: hypothetical protein V4692_09200, partial [Bdellovibrionota bacterium]